MVSNEILLEFNSLPIVTIIEKNLERLNKLKPISLEAEQKVMQKLRLEWNFHSNAIEGNSLTYGETVAFLMHGITAKGKPFKDYLDIKGHNLAIEFLIDFVKNKEEITEADIRNLHKIILVEPYEVPVVSEGGIQSSKRISIGRYKEFPNHVKTITGEIHYYVEPHDVPFAVNELLTWLKSQKNKNEIHPLVLASAFHHRFTEIHPFDDGNGRMGRLLMNLLLMQWKLPPSIIRQDKEERNQYYYCLSIADSGDLKPLIDFLGVCLNNSIELYIKVALGENIDEPDDFEKEFQLFKKEFEGIKNKVELKRDPVVQEEIFQAFIMPLVNSLSKNYHKLKDFFFELNEVIDNPMDQGFSFSGLNKDTINAYVKNVGFPALYIGFELKGFKSEDNSFTVFSEIKFSFGDFRLEISTRRYGFKLGDIDYAYYEFPSSDLIFSDFYNRIPSKSEIQFLANSISKSTLDYIKKVEKNKDSQKLPFDNDTLLKEWESFVGSEFTANYHIGIVISGPIIEFYPSASAKAVIYQKAKEFIKFLIEKYDFSLNGVGYRVGIDDLPF